MDPLLLTYGPRRFRSAGDPTPAPTADGSTLPLPAATTDKIGLESESPAATPQASAEVPRFVLPSGIGRIFVRGIPDGLKAAIVRGGAETDLSRGNDGSMVANVPSGSATLAVWRETFVVPRLVRSEEQSFPVSIGDGYNTTYSYSPTGLTVVSRELSYGRSAVSSGRVIAGIAVLTGAIALGYYAAHHAD